MTEQLRIFVVPHLSRIGRAEVLRLTEDVFTSPPKDATTLGGLFEATLQEMVYLEMPDKPTTCEITLTDLALAGGDAPAQSMEFRQGMGVWVKITAQTYALREFRNLIRGEVTKVSYPVEKNKAHLVLTISDIMRRFGDGGKVTGATREDLGVLTDDDYEKELLDRSVNGVLPATALDTLGLSRAAITYAKYLDETVTIGTATGVAPPAQNFAGPPPEDSRAVPRLAAFRDSACVKAVLLRNKLRSDVLKGFFVQKTEEDYPDDSDYFRVKPPPVQGARETDRAFIRRLAQRNGFRFFVRDGWAFFLKPNYAVQPDFTLVLGDKAPVPFRLVEFSPRTLARRGGPSFQADVDPRTKESVSQLRGDIAHE